MSQEAAIRNSHLRLSRNASLTISSDLRRAALLNLCTMTFLFCRHVVHRINNLVDYNDYAKLSEQQREIQCSFFLGFLMAAPHLFSRYRNKRDALVADRQAVVAGTATEQQTKKVSCLFCHYTPADTRFTSEGR